MVTELIKSHASKIWWAVGAALVSIVLYAAQARTDEIAGDAVYEALSEHEDGHVTSDDVWEASSKLSALVKAEVRESNDQIQKQLDLIVTLIQQNQ
jgi:hypothetical protein